MRLISIFGASNSGKTTFIKAAAKELGPKLGVVSVGAEMSKRYPPEHFNGMAAMPDTEDVVWEIFDEQYVAAVSSGARVILVDGQPRMVEQIHHMLANYPRPEVWWLNALPETQALRASGRHDHELRIARIDNDRVQLFDVIHRLVATGIPLRAIDTEEPEWLCHTLSFLKQEIKR